MFGRLAARRGRTITALLLVCTIGLLLKKVRALKALAGGAGGKQSKQKSPEEEAEGQWKSQTDGMRKHHVFRPGKMGTTHIFQEGEMGIAYDDEGFVEEISLDGQARGKQILKGDQIVKVGVVGASEKYSKAAVAKAEKSGQWYEVTFEEWKDAHTQEVAKRAAEAKINSDVAWCLSAWPDLRRLVDGPTWASILKLVAELPVLESSDDVGSTTPESLWDALHKTDLELTKYAIKARCSDREPTKVLTLGRSAVLKVLLLLRDGGVLGGILKAETETWAAIWFTKFMNVEEGGTDTLFDQWDRIHHGVLNHSYWEFIVTNRSESYDKDSNHAMRFDRIFRTFTSDGVHFNASQDSCYNSRMRAHFPLYKEYSSSPSLQDWLVQKVAYGPP